MNLDSAQKLKPDFPPEIRKNHDISGSINRGKTSQFDSNYATHWSNPSNTLKKTGLSNPTPTETPINGYEQQSSDRSVDASAQSADVSISNIERSPMKYEKTGKVIGIVILIEDQSI